MMLLLALHPSPDAFLMEGQMEKTLADPRLHNKVDLQLIYIGTSVFTLVLEAGKCQVG